ncbi:MAG TPA: hypothetical protein VGH20_01475 [Myxococcales bacterium]|jgi:hypothetical protein
MNGGEVTVLEREVEQLKLKNEEFERERRLLRDEADNKTVLEALSNAGVKGARTEVALNHLRAEKLVKRGEGGGLVFVMPTGYAVELEEGIGEFLKGEDADVFLPKPPPRAAVRKSSAAEAIHQHLFGGRESTSKADGADVVVEWLKGG